MFCRSSDNGNTKYCKVAMGERLTNQQRPLVCTMISSKVPEGQISRVPRTELGKLAGPFLRNQFTEEARTMIQKRVREGKYHYAGRGDSD